MTADQQLPLIPARDGRRAPSGRQPVAADLPVARVALMLPLPHLDHPFDFEVPRRLEDVAAPGARVRVRFAGRLVDGFILERRAQSDRPLSPLRSVHGPSVLTDEVAALCRAIADRYAGTLADVLRFAVPARHARAEARELRGPDAAARRPDVPQRASEQWRAYDGGESLVDRFGSADPTRALWVAGPTEDVADRVAELVRAASARGRGVILVVPDAAEVARMQAGLDRAGISAARLTADQGAESRYATYLSVLRGTERVVLGTRTAVLAPVVDLGGIVVWDDGDEMLAEPHAPGWHAREVAAVRAASARGVSLVVGGTSVTLEAVRMAQSGWLRPVALPRAAVRAQSPRVQSVADLSARDPASAGARVPAPVLGVLRGGLADGPVLVSVPRTGYLPVLACAECREQVRCPTCGGAMSADGPDRLAVCPTHGPQPGWRCRLCGSAGLRAGVTGARRTAEEFGRALPGVPVVTSTGDRRVLRVEERPLVVATPGAEPDPGPAGYAALVILDVAASLSRPGLRVAEELLRRWLAAAALVRPATRGGRVLVVGEPDVREVQALIRWDPVGYAERELAERRGLHLPPAVRMARLSGPAAEVADLARALADDLAASVLRLSGPIPGAGDETTWLLATSIADGPLLASALKHHQAARSARRVPVVVARMDPIRLQ